jgi:hypothetical protein
VIVGAGRQGCNDFVFVMGAGDAEDREWRRNLGADLLHNASFFLCVLEAHYQDIIGIVEKLL